MLREPSAGFLMRILRNYAVIIYQKIRIKLALGALCAAWLNIRMVGGFNQKVFLLRMLKLHLM
jgi:hypothetical protein